MYNKHEALKQQFTCIKDYRELHNFLNTEMKMSFNNISTNAQFYWKTEFKLTWHMTYSPLSHYS
jgi:hypothetical protein